MQAVMVDYVLGSMFRNRQHITDVKVCAVLKRTVV